MKINILLPFFLDRPGGGVKVMYQYANLLAERGHDVVIYHAKKTKWLHRKSFRSWYLYILQRFFGKILRKRPIWFLLNETIQSLQIAWISNHLIRDADVIFSTWWATATEMAELSSAKGNKFNLIQDDGTHHPSMLSAIRHSYQLPVHYLAISKHIQEHVFQHTKKNIPLVSNGLNHREFFVQSPIESRLETRVIMLYSEEEGKGSLYGLQALKYVKSRYTHLSVTLFGVYLAPPQDLPEGFTYYYNPDNLLELYNQSNIFVSPSLQEGWGLPPMEAMACGCACVCTRILGHMEFMDDYTTLLVEPKNISSMADAIIKLIEDNDLRIKLANAGALRVKECTLDKSTDKLEKFFLEACCEK